LFNGGTLKGKTMKKLAMCAIFAASLAAHADENLFGYSTGTDVLPQGAWELYEWITYRTQKHEGTYQAIDYRTEVEYGWSNKMSQALYLNFVQHKIKDSAPLDDTGAPEYPNLMTGVELQGVQTALKYNVFSVYKDPLGLSFYLEPGFSQIFKITGQKQEEWSVELKTLLQKNFMDDLLTVVWNIILEHEVRRFKGNNLWEDEFTLESTAGISYRFVPKWWGGLETRYHSEYPEYGKREHWAVFLGPNVHYGDKKWWTTLTVLPQFKGGPREEGENVHLSEHEKTEYRLKVGYNF